MLAAGEPSLRSRIELQKRGLADEYADDAAAVLARLHEEYVSDERDDDLIFALAELSFHHALHGGDRPYYLAAVVYAWEFLFGDDGLSRLGMFDPRGRLAVDLYNIGLARAFTSDDGKWVALQGGTYALPFGTIDVTFDPDALRWGDRWLGPFASAAELGVRGLRNRYREPGLGAPLNAGTKPIASASSGDDFIARRVKVPVTMLLRLEEQEGSLAACQLHGHLELYPASDAQTVTIAGHSVPLEFEPTSALADMLAESPVWKRELRGFLSGDLLLRQQVTRLGGLEPYRPDRIPVVLVHGTASSAARWAEMVNDLSNDPRVRQRFQIWAFTYDTGNPILYSAMLLRESLAQAVRDFDPDGDQGCLHQMVVIGHSQGGPPHQAYGRRER